MKKVFEFLLVLIIFYGVYMSFSRVIPLFKKDIGTLPIIFSAFLVSGLLIVIYYYMVKTEVSKDLKKHIARLHLDLTHKETIIQQKNSEIHKAQTFKEDLIAEAESYPKPE